jgi:hypothetical protein
VLPSYPRQWIFRQEQLWFKVQALGTQFLEEILPLTDTWFGRDQMDAHLLDLLSTATGLPELMM